MSDDQSAPPSVNGDETKAGIEGAPEGVSLEQLVEALNAENAALKDQRLRAVAELDNIRKRAEKEVADARLYGVTNFAREMLGVADNLRRAIESVPAELRESDGVKALIEGVDLTERDLAARLARFGVKKLEPQGQKFDPNFHEALFEAPDPSVPSGTVVQVMEAGYAIGERVLRPAKVGVSRGGPKVVN